MAALVISTMSTRCDVPTYITIDKHTDNLYGDYLFTNYATIILCTDYCDSVIDFGNYNYSIPFYKDSLLTKINYNYKQVHAIFI